MIVSGGTGPALASRSGIFCFGRRRSCVRGRIEPSRYLMQGEGDHLVQHQSALQRQVVIDSPVGPGDDPDLSQLLFGQSTACSTRLSSP